MYGKPIYPERNRSLTFSNDSVILTSWFFENKQNKAQIILVVNHRKICALTLK